MSVPLHKVALLIQLMSIVQAYVTSIWEETFSEPGASMGLSSHLPRRWKVVHAWKIFLLTLGTFIIYSQCTFWERRQVLQVTVIWLPVFCAPTMPPSPFLNFCFCTISWSLGSAIVLYPFQIPFESRWKVLCVSTRAHDSLHGNARILLSALQH